VARAIRGDFEGESMKVYVLLEGTYGENTIVGVYSSRETVESEMTRLQAKFPYHHYHVQEETLDQTNEPEEDPD
jgi:hypothetical protein